MTDQNKTPASVPTTALSVVAGFAPSSDFNAPKKTMKTGIQLIAEERESQINAEGWTPEHDEQHREGQIAYAASAYALYHGLKTTFPPESFEKLHLEKQATAEWPWGAEWWKPSDDPVRNLVKAGALIAAEIDRITRAGALQNVSDQPRGGQP